MNKILALAPLALLAGCTTSEPYAMSADDEAELAELLGDRVPGEPVSCLPANVTSSTVVDDHTIVYRVGRTRYLQTFDAPCSGLDRIGHVLVIESPMGRTCRGDRARVVETTAGMTGGFCTFSHFIPYRDAD
ncbi:DUF6491 family protein [Sphingomicrobium aestuariivivum]|uniref:DUF6491 family protein n=1 Tax=Sphingomicrobium aestuariivivum TaxID=1582356 RepID=UPI001FD6FF37|nr:DUF6491 family protein [Sphingomicrobium aestuariivivum]MCJ8190997.1 DUF6491 family protein [Sphingomicrobium aestuariivivum]